jgi:hypothetical protein
MAEADYSKTLDIRKLDAEARKEVADSVVAALAELASSGVEEIDAFHVRVGHVKIVDFTKVFTKIVAGPKTDE